MRLVDPRRLKTVPGRKSDVIDCQWIQKLHSFGLLAAAFRPDDSVCVLRAYMRQRAMLTEAAAMHIQHMQKACVACLLCTASGLRRRWLARHRQNNQPLVALAQMNVRLEKVLSDITGTTGLLIIDAILAGERAPHKLARFRDARCKRSEPEIALALEGNWRAEHLFSLKQAVELFRTYQQQITACDREIDQVLASAEEVGPPDDLPSDIRQGKTGKRNDPRFDARGHLYRMTGVDLTQIRGTMLTRR